MRSPFHLGRTILALLSAVGVWAAGVHAQNLLLAYDFNEAATTYESSGTLTSPLTSRGTFQTFGADGSGVSGLPGDRAWDASANTTQGAVTPSNNSALTSPATGLDWSTLSGFTLVFWFKTEQSLDADAATRFFYKADRATTPVGQGLTLRSFSGRLELRIGSTAGEVVVSSTDFGSGSGYNKTNSWIFVALTWDGSTVQFYCGGPDYRLVLAGGGAFSGTIVNHTGNLILGNTSSFNRGLDGWIDNFRLYDGPLTTAELEAMRLADAGVTSDPPVGGPLRALAPDFSVIDEAPGAGDELSAPQLIRLASGRLMVGFEQARAAGKAEDSVTVLASSDDGGINWTRRAVLDFGSARLFAAGAALYAIGVREDLVISRSLDAGLTWSAPVTLATGAVWNRSSGNVWHANQQVTLALLRRVTRSHGGWVSGDFAPVLLRADAAADLTQLASWQFSDELALGDVFNKFDPTGETGRFFGVPFRAPSGARDGPVFERRATMPVGWLDANVVQILDPNHYWHDPSGKTWHVFLRGHTGGAGHAALMKVVEQPDGMLVAAPETVPSGKRMVFVPLPGGEDRFDVCHDAQTGLYWMLSTQAADSMRRPERGGSPAHRGALVLHFSRNMIDWCFAAVVATPDANGGLVRDAALQIDNLDLAIVSRLHGAAPDLITFRRLRNFRNLVY